MSGPAGEAEPVPRSRRPRGRRHGWLIGACGLIALASSPAFAQGPSGSSDARPLRRVEIGFGGGIVGGAPLGSADADLRANTPQPQPWTLFSTDTRFAAAPAVELRVGSALTRRVGAEARVGFHRPELRTSVSADVEDVPALTVVERINQYALEASVVVMVDELRLGRAVPFATAGVGYVRQLHEGLTVVEHGRLLHVGGGVKHWLFVGERGAVRAAGLRGDVRLYFVRGGFELERGARRHAALSGGVFVTF